MVVWTCFDAFLHSLAVSSVSGSLGHWHSHMLICWPNHPFCCCNSVKGCGDVNHQVANVRLTGTRGFNLDLVI
jgi:hypothetical protein